MPNLNSNRPENSHIPVQKQLNRPLTAKNLSFSQRKKAALIDFVAFERK